MVARCTSFADDLYMDQGRVSSRAALLLRSTERHPSDPRCVLSLITSLQQAIVGKGVVPPHSSHHFTTLFHLSHTHTYTTHTTCVSTTQTPHQKTREADTLPWVKCASGARHHSCLPWLHSAGCLPLTTACAPCACHAS